MGNRIKVHTWTIDGVKWFATTVGYPPESAHSKEAAIKKLVDSVNENRKKREAEESLYQREDIWVDL